MQAQLLTQLIDCFPPPSKAQAMRYVDQDRVYLRRVDENMRRFHILATVRSFENISYHLSVIADFKKKNFSASCGCGEEEPCAHAIAAILAACASFKNPKLYRPAQALELYNLDQPLERSLANWVVQFDAAPRALPKPAKPQDVTFVLNATNDGKGNRLSILTFLAPRSKTRRSANLTAFYPTTEKKRTKITPKSLELMALLALQKNPTPRERGYTLEPQEAAKILPRLLETGHCYWQTINAELLVKGNKVQGRFVWEMQPDGTQHCVCRMPSAAYTLLPTEPLSYVNVETGACGSVSTALPDKVVTALLQAPPIAPGQAQSFVGLLKNTIGGSGVALPQTFKTTNLRSEKPVPHLYVYYTDSLKTESRLLLTDVHFYYGKIKVAHTDTRDFLTEAQGHTLVQWERNHEQEAHFLQTLSEYEIISIMKMHFTDFFYRYRNSFQHAYYIAHEDDVDKINGFKNRMIPHLKKAGWQIEFANNLLEEQTLEIEAWYTDIHEKSTYDWFDLELGVIVNGERMNLLPTILQAFEHSQLQTTPEDTVILTLPEKGKLPIPAKRLHAILEIILQLVDTQGKRGAIRVSRHHAVLLLEMEKALSATELRWFGDQRLRQLGATLADFKEIEPVTVPSAFLATLRPYQQEAVNWLQCLSNFQLNGILADDMGLGKTIQILAHLSVEKAKNPQMKPVLIIAPTSVVHHWQREVERFAPSLTALVLQGLDRKSKFQAMSTPDIILTTYPLILRDQDTLLEHTYHMVILDEAQTIKNAQAKMTQVVQQLKAQHRCCLTGTPLENHLGELWSLLHFLMPGLLGTSREFKTRYRNPIEKNQDKTVQAQLCRLIRPFILRRTKQEVIQELPPKTEIIQSVELGKEQRALYESIRLAMHQKVRKAIDQKGLERSQIVILDALLKLRQVCCDPRLLKLEAAKKVSESAKLDRLMEMLGSLCEEGRRILLFSQFTSMLALIEQALHAQQMPYVKLVGNTQDRVTPVQTFQAGNVPLFLISLKAGGTGLNLTAADTVIHYDPWWNPAVEQQATDRAHRMGQEKAVFVYKLVTANTVEEKILEMQKKKGALADALLQGEHYKGKLAHADFEGLFA